MGDPAAMIRCGRQFLGILACAAFLGPVAAAQPAPQQTTATYEDWIVRCETAPGPPPHKTCEMVQFTQMKGQQGVISQLAIGRPVKGQPIKIVIQVPIGVWLPAGVTLVADAKDTGVAAAFKRCVTVGCFAEADIKDDSIKKFRTASDSGQIHFKDANQKDVSLPVSFKGFGTAYDALSKE
jgi:invasion protein IalB